MKRVLAALFLCLLGLPAAAGQVNFNSMPPNTWVPLKYTVDQPRGGGKGEQGHWSPAGWNKVVYDPLGKRVLFYDRWHDKKHGGYTIYGNCLFGFDPASCRVAPLKIDNWTKIDAGGGYRTVELPENAKEPTPCPRHVLDAFEIVPKLNSIFICNGLNQSGMKNGKLLGSELLKDTWRLDVGKGAWTQVKSAQHPRISASTAMTYCQDVNSMVYVSDRQIWLLNLATGAWRKSGSTVPTGGFGQTVTYDPPRKRVLIKGGITAAFDVKPPAGGYKDDCCQKMYAFDPRSGKVTRLADCPTPQWFAPASYDSKRDIFIVANVMKDWGETTNPTPSCNAWCGWVLMCYDASRDCHVAMVYNSNPPRGNLTNREWYAIRCTP
ncbi:MAG: Kelch repeat-containing protein [Planctomycetota bacterium]